MGRVGHQKVDPFGMPVRKPKTENFRTVTALIATLENFICHSKIQCQALRHYQKLSTSIEET